MGPQTSHPRLAVSTVLLGDHINGFVSHFGLKCSSFSPVNAGTSGRTPCTPYGNFHYPSVLEGELPRQSETWCFQTITFVDAPLVYVSQSLKCLVISQNIKKYSYAWFANFSMPHISGLFYCWRWWFVSMGHSYLNSLATACLNSTSALETSPKSWWKLEADTPSLAITLRQVAVLGEQQECHLQIQGLHTLGCWQAEWLWSLIWMSSSFTIVYPLGLS